MGGNVVAQEQGFALEEIVVSAQRIEETLQEVPLAVTAFNEEAIERGGLSNFQDLEHSVPNMAMTVVTPFASWVNVRGIPSNPNGVFNSGTSAGLATYVDGVVFSRPTGFNQELANIARVEVLRGPQGTLFGQNSNLGVINIVTKKPGDTLEAKFKADIGNYGSQKFTGYVSGPLIEDVLAGSISVFDADRDGYVDNVFQGNELDDEDRRSGRIQLRYTPSDNLTADLSLDYLKDRSRSANSDITAISPAPGPSSLIRNILLATPFDDSDIIAPGIRTVTQNAERDLNQRDNYGADLTLEYELDNGFVVKSITARKVYQSLFLDDFDGTGLNIAATSQQEDNEQITQEIQLISPQEEDFRYIAGLFYLDLKSEADQFTDILELAQPLLDHQLEATVDTSSVAAFFHANYDFSENASGFLGVRYSEVEKDLEFSQTQSFAFGFPAFNTTDSIKDDFISWTVGVDYDFEGTFGAPVNGYAKVSRGFKEGGYTVRFLTLGGIGGDINDPDASFDRESVTSYEVGLKGTLLDDRLRTNMALFYLEYDDIQSSLVDNLGNGRITNGPSATSQGVELELTYLISDYLSVSSNIGYVDASYDDFDECNASPNISCSGNALPRSPEWTGNVALSGRYPLDNGWELFGGIDYSYRGSSFTTVENDPLRELDGAELVNMNVGVMLPESGLELQAYIKNATDHEYLTGILNQGSNIFGVSAQRYGTPRTYGVRVSYEF